MSLATDLLEGDGIIREPGNEMASGHICTGLSCSLLHLCFIQGAVLVWSISSAKSWDKKYTVLYRELLCLKLLLIGHEEKLKHRS